MKDRYRYAHARAKFRVLSSEYFSRRDVFLRRAAIRSFRIRVSFARRDYARNHTAEKDPTDLIERDAHSSTFKPTRARFMDERVW